MKYTKLGSSGTVVSKIALGTMDFGSETPEEAAFGILDAFLEAGGNFVDTANVYVGSVAEQILGRWMAARPSEITDRVVLATKGRSRMGPGVNDAGLSRRHLHRALNASLRRLGVETVDLYQLHASDMHTPMEETLAFLEDAVRAGKINDVGLSNFTGWELQLFVSTAKAMGAPIPVSLQPKYSPCRARWSGRSFPQRSIMVLDYCLGRRWLVGFCPANVSVAASPRRIPAPAPGKSSINGPLRNTLTAIKIGLRLMPLRVSRGALARRPRKSR
jgi:aryl-alcohol dehydrogenase-like predicted oxidoreductase